MYVGGSWEEWRDEEIRSIIIMVGVEGLVNNISHAR